METCNMHEFICGGCGTGKTSWFITSLEEVFMDRFIILAEIQERELEEAFRSDLTRKNFNFVEYPVVNSCDWALYYPICLWTSYRNDEVFCVEKEKRYASVELDRNEQIESIEKISFSKLHILFQNNIVNPGDTLKSFVYDIISALKNIHAKGQVRSLIPLKKRTKLKLFKNEKRLHRPYLLFLCKKRVLRSSVKKKQIWNCKSNSTLKNLYYEWTSVLQIWLSCRDRRDQEYLFEC